MFWRDLRWLTALEQWGLSKLAPARSSAESTKKKKERKKKKKKERKKEKKQSSNKMKNFMFQLAKTLVFLPGTLFFYILSEKISQKSFF